MGSMNKRFRNMLIFLVGLGAPIYSQDTLSTDAVILTLRMQEGIWLDSTLAEEIDGALTAARQTYDTLTIYHAFPDYVPDMLIVGLDTFCTSWDTGSVMTGDSFLDSLNLLYHLVSVNRLYGPYATYLLTYAQPLQIERLADIYQGDESVIWAEPNGSAGDGPNIWTLFKYNHWLLVFSYGWGDCPAGCIHRDYWYVSVDSNGTALLEEMLPDDHPTPHLYRWNIPTAWCMGMFANADSIYSAIATSSHWWVRRHAVEGLWRFYYYDVPWCDYGNSRPQWEALRSELLGRYDESLAILNQAQVDPDPDVAASAQTAYVLLQQVSTTPQIVPPQFYELSQNYPNPFNTSTKFKISVPREEQVRLAIHDLLGREVAVLINGVLPPGNKEITWDAGNIASGIYFYRLETEETIITRKMAVVK